MRTRREAVPFQLLTMPGKAAAEATSLTTVTGGSRRRLGLHTVDPLGGPITC